MSHRAMERLMSAAEAYIGTLSKIESASDAAEAHAGICSEESAFDACESCESPLPSSVDEAIAARSEQRFSGHRPNFLNRSARAIASAFSGVRPFCFSSLVIAVSTSWGSFAAAIVLSKPSTRMWCASGRMFPM